MSDVTCTIEPPTPPSEVPGFRVGRLLGQGGSALVWLVTDERGGRFALKVARTPRTHAASTGQVAVPAAPAGADTRRRGRRAAPFPDDGTPALPPVRRHCRSDEDRPGPVVPDRDSGRDGIERELRLLQRFTHEHLVRVHRLVDTDQGPGIVMDLAAGGSLLGLVTSRGPLPIPEVVTALVPVAQVLGHLHGAGALHGDVTPGNILFTHEGKPLLGDLGVVRLLGSDPGAVAGTAGFVDPTGIGSFDAASDIFALAAVAWFALTGRIPGPAEHRPPLALIVPDVPPALMQLIEDGLSPRRERRPSADSFARSLLGSSKPEPINLVPAVHASVRPELLTRRAVAAPAPTQSWWKRLTSSGSGSRPRGFTRAPALPDRVPESPRCEVALPAPAAGRSRARGGKGPNGPRERGFLAIAAGMAAVVLLVAGIVLTVGEQPASDSSATVQTSSAQDQGAGSGSKPRGAEQEPGTPFTSFSGQEVPGRSTRGEAPPNEGSNVDPAVALDELADLRASAFATADAGLLVAVDVEGSPAMTADREAVAALAGSGKNLKDLTIDIRDSSVLTAGELSAMPAVGSLPSVTGPPAATHVAVVRATAKLSSYTETAASSPASSPASARASAAPDADEPGRVMAAGQQELLFILWNSGEGWRIHSVGAPTD
ncbi:serine/threonine protein kinase [Arthrobacter sp. NamB2]|uniref:protein kinase domain-containing protein n=1 Tax=Arthrobacter sp. NamB2 TaxID=2576035 RepID=UPI0010C93F64|nr:serine/threonine-protein kinase [Arthrobacter sp. NamB2]TKV28205.1 serine/threonine protein kinase [Arthrobacter sp. NamB2]